MAKKMGVDPSALGGAGGAGIDLDKLKNLGAGPTGGLPGGLPGLGAKPSSGLFGGLPGLPGSKPFDPTKK